MFQKFDGRGKTIDRTLKLVHFLCKKTFVYRMMHRKLIVKLGNLRMFTKFFYCKATPYEIIIIKL